MALQNTLAGSHNVDIVYGPSDKIKPVIMHLGEKLKVDLVVELIDLSGKIVASKKYQDVLLKGGRSATTLPEFEHEVGEGYYIINYNVVKEK